MEFAIEVSEPVEQALKGSLDFETLEGIVRETSLRIEAQTLETLLNSNTDAVCPSIRHSDGTVMTYAGKRAAG